VAHHLLALPRTVVGALTTGEFLLGTFLLTPGRLVGVPPATIAGATSHDDRQNGSDRIEPRWKNLGALYRPWRCTVTAGNPDRNAFVANLSATGQRNLSLVARSRVGFTMRRRHNCFISPNYFGVAARIAAIDTILVWNTDRASLDDHAESGGGTIHKRRALSDDSCPGRATTDTRTSMLARSIRACRSLGVRSP